MHNLAIFFFSLSLYREDRYTLIYSITRIRRCRHCFCTGLCRLHVRVSNVAETKISPLEPRWECNAWHIRATTNKLLRKTKSEFFSVNKRNLQTGNQRQKHLYSYINKFAVERVKGVIQNKE